MRDTPLQPGKSLFVLIAVVTLGLWALVAPPHPPAPLLTFNGSKSIPVGFYRRTGNNENVPLGSIVLATTPSSLADQYPAKMIKVVRGLPHDTVCYWPGHLTVNGVEVGPRVATKPAGSILWGCVSIAPGQVLLLGHHHRSLDGRYFGPVGADQVLGQYAPLFTWGT